MAYMDAWLSTLAKCKTISNGHLSIFLILPKLRNNKHIQYKYHQKVNLVSDCRSASLQNTRKAIATPDILMLLIYAIRHWITVGEKTYRVRNILFQAPHYWDRLIYGYGNATIRVPNHTICILAPRFTYTRSPNWRYLSCQRIMSAIRNTKA